MLVYFWLEPDLLFGVENEDIVYNSFFPVAFATAKNYEVLAELGRTVTIAG